MTTTAVTDRAADQGFAALIRSATAQAHQDAESSVFVVDLLEGKLPVGAYALLARQHHVIYAALERATDLNQVPELVPFFVPELRRLDSIEADLEFLAGPDWHGSIPTAQAAHDYADRITVISEEWPEGVLAHHYIRCMGDLSGGQLLMRKLARIYEFADGRGTDFYRFDHIASPQAFKVNYRQMLDNLDWDTDTKKRFVEEVSLAFDHHGRIFADLATMSPLISLPTI